MAETASSQIHQKKLKRSHPLCFHCGLSTNNPLFLKEEPTKIFCCHGCLSVYKIIEESKLGEYYEIKKDSDSSSFIPAPTSRNSFEHFDDNNFKNEYVKEFDNSLSIKLYLEGVHCIACLWLIENIPQIISGVIKSEFDFDNSVVTVLVNKKTKLSEVVKLIDKLGYPPHPIRNDDEASELKALEERSYLIKLGISMACMGNILLFSISIYAGLEGGLKETFNWLSFVISLPVISFCALPFYKSALASLRQKKLNMDFPISVALIAGTISGLISLITKTGEVYFDSLTSLVFLLLLSRYTLLKIRQKGVTSSNLEYFSSFGKVCVLENQSSKVKTYKMAKFLKASDLILLKDGDIIPADGEILEGYAYLNTSLLTGESLPIRTGPWKKVFSGTAVTSGEIIVKVLKTGTKTKLGQILQTVKSTSAHTSPFASLSEKVSRYFIGIVFLISLLTILYFTSLGTPVIGITRALTLLIVTCPCALALATPLALTASISNLLKKGIVLKNEDAIEKISKASRVYLDKTGTLTKGSFEVLSFTELTDIDHSSVIWTMENKASHPVAESIKNYLKSFKAPTEEYMEELLEIPGFGVKGVIGNNLYELKRDLDHNGSGTGVALYKNNTPVTRMILKDSLRDDSKKAIDDLKKQGLKPIILSGDTKAEVLGIADELGLNSKDTFSKITPEGKLKIIEEDFSSIMVGDGANDAMALSKARAGIAVKGSLDISLKAADIYFTRPGIGSLNTLIHNSKRAVKTIKVNILFSLMFNLVGSYLALSGIITPLIAAVLMPLSSLSVLLSTYLLSKEEN